VYSRSRD
jgi:superfamily II DNA helicase RecQ